MYIYIYICIISLSLSIYIYMYICSGCKVIGSDFARVLQEARLRAPTGRVLLL